MKDIVTIGIEEMRQELKDRGALILSNSRIKKRRSCDRAHYYRYVDKLNKKRKGDALIRGSAIHNCIEYYNTGRSWKKAYKEFQDEWNAKYLTEEKEYYGDIPKMVYDLMEGYIEYYEDEDLEYLESEKEFLICLDPDNDIWLLGYIDFIAKDTKGNIWIGETKTHKRFPDSDMRLFNMQSSIYIWALQKLGYKNIKGVIWNYIKAKQPTTPRVLTSGKISTARLDSIPSVVTKFLKEQGEDLSKYQEFINGLNWEDYYRRYEVRASQDVVDSVMEDVLETALDIQNQPHKKARNLNSQNCGWCDYKSICQAELAGADVSFILKSQYETRKEENNNGDKKEERSKKSIRTKIKNGRPNRNRNS
ncbi:MAG: PD-(D/E)XK nuclease family protein [Fusobacteriaceae bacterium]